MPELVGKNHAWPVIQAELKSFIPGLIIVAIIGVLFAIAIVTIATKVYPMMHPHSDEYNHPVIPAQIVHDGQVYNNLSQDHTVSSDG